MEYEFVKPMFGFEGLTRVELVKIDDYFTKMAQVPNSHISFTLLNPFALRPYDIEIPEHCVQALEITDKNEIMVLNVMIIHKPIEESTVNFVAPILFNERNKKCMQVILDATKYPQYGILEKIKNYME